MLLEDSLFSIFGVTGLLGLELGALVALLLAGSLSATVLEAARVYREYASPAPAAPRKGEQKPMLLPEKSEKIDITKLGHIAPPPPSPPPASPAPIVLPASTAPLVASAPRPPPVAPRAAPPEPPKIDVLKATMQESLKAITAKYRLEWLTIATPDGLVVASTSDTPDEEAAIYSNLFNELYRIRAESYFRDSNRGIHLLLIESNGQRVIDIARKPGILPQDDAGGLRDDSLKVVQKFVWGQIA